jgi:hypothetical protein
VRRYFRPPNRELAPALPSGNRPLIMLDFKHFWSGSDRSLESSHRFWNIPDCAEGNAPQSHGLSVGEVCWALLEWRRVTFGVAPRTRSSCHSRGTRARTG